LERNINLILIISFGQNFNKIWICKVYVFVMFKMKYLINRINVTHYHNKCGGLLLGVFTFILDVKGSNFTNDVFMVNSGKLTKCSVI
jgi:hypothetical protein